MQKKLNILIFYDMYSTQTNTVYEYLRSFELFSKNNIFYAHAVNNVEAIDLNHFDVVLFHYSVRLSLTWHLSPHIAQAVEKYKGYKALFIQDEYDGTETARCWMERLGFNAVFTCVPKDYIAQVYPKSRFPNVEFIQVLTGYVPIFYEALTKYQKSFSERKFVIGYRGRALPYWYGDLCREKLIIAQKMHGICKERNIPVNIAWNDNERIYGEKWYEFLAGCKATLGTESGSNVFDDYGEIKKSIEHELTVNPNASYEEIFQKYLVAHEGRVMMNQVSPRIFESISLKVALVLFEGTYSDVVLPNQHYIPLKKDFSNIDDVLEKLSDDLYLDELTTRAYNDIILSEKYSYKNFIESIEQFLSSKIVSGIGGEFIMRSIKNSATNLPVKVNEIPLVQSVLFTVDGKSKRSYLKMCSIYFRNKCVYFWGKLSPESRQKVKKRLPFLFYKNPSVYFRNKCIYFWAKLSPESRQKIKKRFSYIFNKLGAR